ncbi:MAG TPA: ABC transporter substrate-binding protein [Spirochaetia bacterium]|nr:ABC transporter substrate-binding protein [Spirochaetia bacterium]
MKIKRFALSLILILTPLVLLFAKGQPESGVAQQGAPVQLTIAGRDGVYGDAMQYATDAYTKLHPNVTFQVLKLPYDSQYQKVVIDMKSGTGTYDLIMIDDPNAPQFMKAGWLASLDQQLSQRGEKLDPDLISAAVRVGRYPYSDSGTLYALPHVGNVEMFAFRKDLIAKYGLAVPKTWTDVLADAKALKADDPSVTPIIFRGVKGNPIVSGFLPILWAFGGEVLNGDTAAVDSPQALAALNFFLSLKPYAPQGVDTWNAAQVRDALYSGSAAIATEVWPSWVGDLENPDKSKVVGKVTVAAPPSQTSQSAAVIGAWLLGIPKDSHYVSSAFDFLMYVTGKEMQTQLADQFGIAPSRKSVLEDPQLQKKFPWFPGQEQALENGRARARTSHWPEIETTFGTYLQLALIGQMSAQDALKTANDKIQAIVSQ